MLSRDSCLQHDTRNSFGTSGHVLGNLLAPGEPPAAIFGNSKNMASASCGPVPLNTGRIGERVHELERDPQKFAIPTPRFARKFSTWNPPSQAEGAYQQSCMVELPRNQVSELHFDKFLDPPTFQCWETNFKTEVCSSSGFLAGTVLWIQEVEIVDSVDDLQTSQSKRWYKISTFEMLDSKIASALKRIIPVSLEEQKAATQDRFLRGQIACMIYEHFRVAGAHEAALDLTDLFSVSLQGDDIQDLSPKMIFKVRNERIETGVLVKTQQGKNVSAERKSGECCQWKAKRTVFKKEMLSASATTTISVERQPHRPILLQDRRHRPTEEDLRVETPPWEVVHPERSIKNRARITSKEFARILRESIGILPYVETYRTESGCKFGDKRLFRHTEADSQPSRKSMKSGGKGSGCFTWRSQKHVDCVFQDTEPPTSKSILRKGTKSDRTVRFTKGTLHHIKFWRRERPFQGVIQKCEPQERSPWAPKVEDGTQEEILQRERCGRSEAWDWATSSITRMRPRSSRRPKFGHYQHHLRRNRGKTLCCKFWSVNAHAKQERSELSWTEGRSSIQKPYNGYHSQWTSANKWGSNSSRPWALRDGANPRGHACSLVERQALRRTRIFIWVDQWSKTTANTKWQNICAIRKMSCRLLSKDWRLVSPARAQVRLLHRYRRTSLMVSLQVQQRNEVTTRTSRNRSRNSIKNKSKNGDNVQASRNRLRDMPDWSEEFTENLEDKEVPNRKKHTRKHFSIFRFGTSYQSGVEEAQY